jgi:hypothetical protein
MANTFVTPSWVVKEIGRLSINNMKFSANVMRKYSADFVKGGAKIGSQFLLRLPWTPFVSNGQAFQPQSVVDVTVPVAITDQAQLGISWSTFDATLTVEDVRNRYIRPEALALSNYIDYQGLARMTPLCYWNVGTPGTNPTTNQTYLDAGVKLDDIGCPVDGRVAILKPQMMATLVGTGNLSLFNPSKTISAEYKSGMFSGEALGVDEWYKSQNVYSRTTGSFTTATPLVDGANQTGSSLITKAWASGATTLQVGDKITIDGVFALNPLNKASTGSKQQFTILTQATDTSGAITLNISPAITVLGSQATVTASPADNAAIQVVGSTITTGSGALTATATAQSLIYHPDAFVLAMVDPDSDLPGADASSITGPAAAELGFALRYVRQYSALTDQKVSRVDAFFGWAGYRTEWACVINGA